MGDKRRPEELEKRVEEMKMREKRECVEECAFSDP